MDAQIICIDEQTAFASGDLLSHSPAKKSLWPNIWQKAQRRCAGQPQSFGRSDPGRRRSKNRLDLYLEDLKNPHVEYISIKISTIYSQINPIA